MGIATTPPGSTELIRVLLGAVFPSRSFTVAGLVAAVAVVSFLLYAERPRIGRRTIIAFVPWMIAGSALYVLADLVSYPAAVSPLVEADSAYLSTYVVVGVAWFAILQLSTGKRTVDHLPDYLAAMGFGAAMVLATFVVLGGESVAPTRFVWPLIAPVAAGAAAFVVLFMLGFWYIDAPAYTGVVGALVVFGQTLDGIATTLGIGLFDTARHTYLSWRVLDWVAGAQAAGIIGGDRLLVWAWGFLWVKMVIGTVAVILLTPVARERESLGYLLLGLLAAVGITSGVTELLLIVIGGSP